MINKLRDSSCDFTLEKTIPQMSVLSHAVRKRIASWPKPFFITSVRQRADLCRYLDFHFNSIIWFHWKHKRLWLCSDPCLKYVEEPLVVYDAILYHEISYNVIVLHITWYYIALSSTMMYYILLNQTYILYVPQNYLSYPILSHFIFYWRIIVVSYD